jgi:triacylglycerol lipase
LLAGALAFAAVALPASSAPAAQGPYPVSYLFTDAFTAQMQHPDAPPPGANDFSCKPSTAHPDPVVLVHGWFATMTVNWQTISPVLANNGYCVFALTYGRLPNTAIPGYRPGGVARIEDSAKELAAFVDQVRSTTGAQKVDIVGHSEGSLMPNWYVKFLGGAAEVDHYVAITPLWHGSNPAGLATLDQLGRTYAGSSWNSQWFDSYCGSCREFLTGSDFMNRMREGGVAAGGVSYTNLITRNDELVSPYKSGIETGMTNIIVQDQCALDQADHVAMAADPIVAQDVLNALDPADAKPPPCTPVLPGLGAPLYHGPQ